MARSNPMYTHLTEQRKKPPKPPAPPRAPTEEELKRAAQASALIERSRATGGTLLGETAPADPFAYLTKNQPKGYEPGLTGALGGPGLSLNDAIRLGQQPASPAAEPEKLPTFAEPDLTDKLVREARTSTMLRLLAGRGRRSTFLTGPQGLSGLSLLGGGPSLLGGL